MKLHNGDHSPYSTRVRLVIRLLSLPVCIEPPALPLRTPAFRAAYPLGKIPLLELDDGRVLPESTAIMEYLAESDPGNELLPSDPWARAQMNLFSRYADTHLAPAGLFPIFRAMMQGQAFEHLLPALCDELAKGDALLASLPPCRERPLHLGDLALAPSLKYVDMLAPLLKLAPGFAGYPALADWWGWVNDHPVVASTLEEMAIAYRDFAAVNKK